MSIYTNKATMSLLNMTNEMNRKNIEISRIIKTSVILLMTGLSPNCVNGEIVKKCINSQQEDGGFVGNSDTIWNIVFLKYFKQYDSNIIKAINWLLNNSGADGGFGRSKRDMCRIPVTGTALYLLPEIYDIKHLEWLESTWISEVNSLTYKAAYTLLAFSKCNYNPKHNRLINDSLDWLATQQDDDGGFAPWYKHPVGTNIYCTAIAVLGLLTFGKEQYSNNIIKAYEYMKSTQLKSGIWPYHEIEDGSSWGLLAMTKVEEMFGEEIL